MSTVALATIGGFGDPSSAVLHVASKWPRPVTVIEADPDGGRLAHRHGLRPGLSDLATVLRRGTSVQVPGRVFAVPVVPASPDPDETIGALHIIAPMVGRLRMALGTDVLFDVGILRPQSPSEGITRATDARILMMRCTLEDVAVVLHRHRTLQALGRWTVLTAGGSLTTPQVSRVIRWPILADLTPFDRRNQTVLSQRVAEFAIFVESESGR